MNSFCGSTPPCNQPCSELIVHLTLLGVQGALGARKAVKTLGCLEHSGVLSRGEM